MAASNKLEDLKVITRAEQNPDKRNLTNPEKRAARNSRVHFGDFEDVDTSVFSNTENQILLVESVKEELHKTVSAYFGFLQEAHRYEVKFGVPIEEIKTYVMARDEKLEVKKQPDQSRLIKMSWEDNETLGLILMLEMEVDVNSGDSFEDRFIIRSDSIPNRYIHFRIGAQVLGKGQGTPTLKCGIKCLGHCSSDSPPGSPRNPSSVSPSRSPKDV